MHADSLDDSRIETADHEFVVPLDHARPSDEKINVFVREVSESGARDRPFLLFLQGGPGHEAPRPISKDDPGWLRRAVKSFRVLLLDQRGTGRSSPAISETHETATRIAERLQLFRADSIVEDAEYVREAMRIERWSVLGQSFGGFCAVTYLSLAPQSLSAVLVAGGLPPLGASVDDVYKKAYDRTLERNVRYYARYPGDRARVRAIHDRLSSEPARLPSGGRLTSRRFRQVGNVLGKTHGLERLHYLLDSPVESPAFLHDVESALPFERNPLYVALHEACYADGCSTRWAAQRTMPQSFDDPALFFGEMIFDWMFDDYPALAPFRDPTRILAHHDWAPLYDIAQLRRNAVPFAAVVYEDDLYLDRSSSVEAASMIRGAKVELVRGREHDALTFDGSRILDRALALVR